MLLQIDTVLFKQVLEIFPKSLSLTLKANAEHKIRIVTNPKTFLKT